MTGDELARFEAEVERQGGYLADLLDQVATFLSRFIVFPNEHGVTAVTLWVAFTHVAAQFDVAPYMLVTAPENLSKLSGHPCRPPQRGRQADRIRQAMSRTHTQYQRRRSSGPRLRGATVTTWEEAMAMAAECACPTRVNLDNPTLAVVAQRHRHACPALRKRWR